MKKRIISLLLAGLLGASVNVYASSDAAETALEEENTETPASDLLVVYFTYAENAELENLDSYNTIFLGFPNWWGDMPMAVYSFLDAYDLSGKTIAPFVTSGGSGFSSTIDEIESLEPEAEIQEGLSISASQAAESQDIVQDWLNSLGYLQ